MFSPRGYTSLASQWVWFAQNYYTKVYSYASQDYAGPNAKRSFLVGSPADICEHLFWLSLLGYRVVVASNRGSISEVTLEADRQFQAVYLGMTVFESARVAADSDEAGQHSECLQKFGSVRFTGWEYDHDDAKAWSKEFPILDDAILRNLKIEAAPFCTLPYVFERLRFVVPDIAPPWASDAYAKDYINTFVVSFPGWSFCLNSEDLPSWQKNAGKSVTKFFDVDPVSGPGRSSDLIDAVMAAVRARYPNGRGEVPWKVVQSAIVEDIGREFSLDTLKRAFKVL